MQINLAKIYEKNILYKYDETNRDQYESDFSEKQRDMWYLSFTLLKDNFPEEIYDNEKDKEFLESYFMLHFYESQVLYTVDEWFDYMKSME